MVLELPAEKQDDGSYKFYGNNKITLPGYWLEHLGNKIAAIQSLQESAGRECFSFVVITDIHYSSNLGKRSPLIAKKIMDSCGIKYAMILGDLQSRGAWSTKDAAKEELRNAITMLNPLLGKSLIQKGNHDGSYGTTLNGTTYPYNFTPEELYDHLYRYSYMLDNVTIDDTGTAYYIDHAGSKVRYLMLNAMCNPYALSDDGSVMYNNMRTFRFTQSQFDFVVAVCESMQDGWSLVVGCHVPISNAYGDAFNGSDNQQSIGDHAIMRELLKAYKNKTTYAGSWSGSADYDAVTVTADFTAAKGEFVAWFAGHAHNDYLYANTDWGIDIITTRSDAAVENTTALLEERVAGTITEQCLDVFTVNRKTGIVNATRIGVGDDRYFKYKDVSEEEGDEGEETPTEPTGVTNQIPLSLASVDGSEIYNGVGYKNGVYLSGEDGAITEGTDANIVTSGYIPYVTTSSSGEVIYSKGVVIDTSVSHNRMVFWSPDNAKNPLIIGNTLLGTFFKIEKLEDKYYKLTPYASTISNNRGVLSHIRLSASGKGEDWIVSIGTPID